MLEGHAVHGAAGKDTHVKAVHLDVLEEEGADVLGKSHVDAVEACAVAGMDLHVVDGALDARVEADADGARVALAGTDGKVADGVPLLDLRAFAGHDDGSGEVRVVESLAVVLELDDGAAHALALQDGAFEGILGLFAFGPGERVRNLVDAVGQVDDVVTVRVVVQGLLDGFGVIGLAVTLRVVGCLAYVHDFGTQGKLDLGDGLVAYKSENKSH